MKVNICGLKHKVIECEDVFNVDCHLGQIEYKDLLIKINKDMPDESKKETICHKMVHGILCHMGYGELSNDEKLVQALGNAIYQGFEIIDFEKKEKNELKCENCTYYGKVSDEPDTVEQDCMFHLFAESCEKPPCET